MQNPAGRLHYWLQRARENGPRHGESALVGWADVFHFDLTDGNRETRALTVSKVSALALLPYEIRRSAALLPVNLDPDLLIEPLEEVDRAMDQVTTLEGLTLGQFINPLTAAGLHALRLLDSFFDSHLPQAPWINDDAAATLIEQAEDLISEARHAVDEVGDQTVDFIVEHLTAIIYALRERNIDGVEPVAWAVDAMIGSTHREPEKWRSIAGSKIKMSFVVFTYAMITALGTNVVDNVLPPGGEPTPAISVIVNDSPGAEVHVSDADDLNVHDAEIVEDDETPPPDQSRPTGPTTN